MAGIDRERIQAAVAEILAAIGEDPAREGLRETPERVADAYAEFFAGVGQNPADHLTEALPGSGGDDETAEAKTAESQTEVGSAEVVGASGGVSDAVLLRNIRFRSVCEHHLLPFLGVAHVAYVPGDRVVGLGKLPRVVETLAARPQMQERLTDQIADTLEEGLGARGVLVVLDAVHGCVVSRGARQTDSSTVTIAGRGELAEPAARAEVLALIGSGTPAGSGTGASVDQSLGGAAR